MKKVVFVLFILSLFLGVSCSDISETDESSITVFLPGASSRAAVPENITSCSIFLCPGENLDSAALASGKGSDITGTLMQRANQCKLGVIPGGSVEFPDLDKGIYQIAVLALDQKNRVIGLGLSSASVSGGGNTSVSITVKKVGKYIYISSPEDLKKINEAGNESANFILQNDLTIDHAWTVEAGHNLRGTFDGQNHTITFSGTTACPLFMEIEAGSEISNLTLKGKFEAPAANSWSSFSPFTLKNCAGSTISNCSFDGSIRNLGGLSYVFGGGDGTIENCPGFTENISTGDTIYTIEYEFTSPALTFDGMPDGTTIQNWILQFKENISEVYSLNKKYCKSSESFTLTASNVSIRTSDGRTITSCGFYETTNSVYQNAEGDWVVEFAPLPTLTIAADPGVTGVKTVKTLVDID